MVESLFAPLGCLANDTVTGLGVPNVPEFIPDHSLQRNRAVGITGGADGDCNSSLE